MELLFKKLRKVKSPTKANPFDMGIDFFIPEFDEDFIESFISKNPNVEVGKNIVFRENKMVIEENVKSFLIPSGISVNLPKEYGLVFFNKSKISSQYCLDVGACVIDYGYTGEIHIHFFNNNTKILVLESGRPIIQGLIIPLINVKLKEMGNLEYEYDRGDRIGSSWERLSL